MHVQEEITIDLPAEQIFSYLVEVRNRSTFIPQLEEVVLLDDPPLKVGSRYIEVALIAGQRLRTTYQITELAKDQRICAQTLKSVFPIKAALNLEEGAGQTIVQVSLNFELLGIYRLAAGLIRGIVRKQAREILIRLKQTLE